MLNIFKTPRKLRWVFDLCLFILCWLPFIAYADGSIHTILKNAPDLAFDDLKFYPKFATSVTLKPGSFVIDTIEFKESDLSVNRYGKPFGVVNTSIDENLRETLISNGAAIYNGLGPYPAALRAKLLAAEGRARDAAAGIWMQKRVYLSSEIEEKTVEEGFELVQGIVKSVVKRKSGTYLNFGENWKTDLTVQISPRNRASFRKLSWTLEDLETQTIRVRGWLRNYNGPFMQIYFPEQIEILKK